MPALFVVEDAVAHLKGQIEAAPFLFEHVDDAQRLHVVRKTVRRQTVQHPLARMAEGSMAQVVPEGDRLGKVFVQSQAAGNGTGDLRHVDGVRHAGAEVISFRRKKDLRLVFQPQKRLAVDDAVAVALKIGAHAAGLFLPLPALGIFGTAGVRRKKGLFDAVCALFDGIFEHGCPRTPPKRRYFTPNSPTYNKFAAQTAFPFFRQKKFKNRAGILDKRAQNA